MTITNTQGLLSEVQAHFQDHGWDSSILDSISMEYVPGSDNGTGESQQQEQGSTHNDPSGQGSQTQPPQQQQQPSNPFLNEVDPAHRQIVEPYLKKWDGSVTQRFQELQSRYRPYDAFVQQGVSPEDLQNAYGVYQSLNSDPKAFYEALAEALKDELEQGPGSNNGNGQQFPFQGLPEEFQTEYQQTRQAVEAMAQFILDQQDQQKASQEDAELETYLTGLKKQHGDFDEEYVLAKMYATGCSGDQAIAAWKNSLQQFVNQSGGMQPKSGFKALSGGGSVPMESQKVTDLSRKDTSKLVASILEASQREN